MEEMSLREGLEIIHSECKKCIICAEGCRFYKDACVIDINVDLNEECLNKAIEICKGFY